MIRLAGQLGDGPMSGGGNNPCISRIVIRVEHRVLLIRGWNLRPQNLRALATTITDMEGSDLAGIGIHGNPDPVTVRLLTHEAPELIHLSSTELENKE